RALAERPAPPVTPRLKPIEAAYAERGITASLEALVYVGRAITPTRVFRRFNTRFFLADDGAVFGDPVSSDELEDVGWHPTSRRQRCVSTCTSDTWAVIPTTNEK